MIVHPCMISEAEKLAGMTNLEAYDKLKTKHIITTETEKLTSVEPHHLRRRTAQKHMILEAWQPKEKTSATR